MCEGSCAKYVRTIKKTDITCAFYVKSISISVTIITNYHSVSQEKCRTHVPRSTDTILVDYVRQKIMEMWVFTIHILSRNTT